jgi:hypothetical protein
VREEHRNRTLKNMAMSSMFIFGPKEQEEIGGVDD